MTSSKRPRTEDPGYAVLYAFKVHTNIQDQYEPLKLELLSNMQVCASQSSDIANITRSDPHGHWSLDDDGLLTVLWHYQGNIHKAKLQHFQKIPHTNAYERINCDFAWRSILIPWTD
jgi:hypothetical protein